MAQFATLTDGDPRTLVLVLGEGESVAGEFEAFAVKNGIGAASVTAIGGFREAVLGFFDPVARGYVEIPVREQAEVLSLVGDIGRDEDGRIALHAHVVLGLRDGGTRGGHLVSATVRPTLEVMVTESSGELRRRYHKDVGLSLIEHVDLPRQEEWSPEDPLRHGLAP